MVKDQNSYSAGELAARIIAVALIIIAFILFLLFISFCFVYFPPKLIGNQLSSMGLIGDFFGGVLGIILSIATLGATIYLALIVHKIERDSSKKSIEAQRKVVLMQLKFSELALFTSSCDKAIDTIIPYKMDPELPIKETKRTAKSELIESVYVISRAIDRITTLFPELERGAFPHNLKSIELEYMRLMNIILEENAKLTDNLEKFSPQASLKRFSDAEKSAREYYTYVVKQLSEWAVE